MSLQAPLARQNISATARVDVLISGGRLVDGSGAPWRIADLAISGERVVAVGRLQGIEAGLHIDARGHIVCPGFIDMHSHADLALLTGRDMDGRLRQGITTEVVGQDGLSYAPASATNLQAWRRYLVGLNGDAPGPVWTWRTVGEFLEALEGRAANAVYLIPHGAVRVQVMGWDACPAGADALQDMRALVRRGLAEGAAGLSTGLSYVPCAHATTGEMVALCQEVAEAGGFYGTHLRSYGAQVLAALDEAIEIGRRSGVAVHISHLRVADPSLWGLAAAMLERIDRARDAGVDVTFDLYPYTVGCAPLFVLLPLWAQSGGPERILARLRKPSEVARMVAEMSDRSVDWTTYSLSNLPASLPCGRWDGLPLVEVAARHGVRVEALIPRLLLESDLDATIIACGGNEEDNDRLLSHPACMIGSDGVLLGRHPHPRGFGSYPRLLAHYVRQTGQLGWEEAIQKMTGLPAARLNLQDRGLLRVGSAADVVVLDPDTVADGATFAEGRRPPAGIEWVLVNGRVMVDRGEYLEGGTGRALRPLCHRRELNK
jgi:N-acyl-D-amino-acid deacylase